ILKSGEIATHIFKNSDLQPFLFYGSLAILPNVMIFINSEGLRGIGKIKEYVFLQSVGVYLFSVLLFLFTFFNYSESLIIIQIYLFSNIIIFIVSTYWWYQKVFKHIISTTTSIKDIFKVSFPMFWSNIMLVIFGWT